MNLGAIWPNNPKTAVAGLLAWLQGPTALVDVLPGEVITKVYDATPWFHFRLRSGWVVRINPYDGFAWVQERENKADKVWVTLPGGLRVDRLTRTNLCNYPALRLDCTGTAQGISLKLAANRAGDYRLLFPNL